MAIVAYAETMSDLFNELMAERHRRIEEADAALPIGEVCDRIARLVQGLAAFWSNCSGWAPEQAATLLGTSRLDRIASLAVSLKRWTDTDTLSDGDLILAWTNLGAVMEGVLKIFLCAYVQDYRADDASRKTRAYRAKEDVLRDPDGLMLDTIIKYVELAELLPPEEIALAAKTQSRRNAIHAFRDRDLGTASEFHQAVRQFRTMSLGLHYRLPYPDEVRGFYDV